MTKIIHAWMRVGFWMKIKAIIAALGIGGEITLFIIESHPGWKIVAAIATMFGIFISILIEDKDNNGIADIFQKKLDKPKKDE